jgi:hypothetical protein
MHVRKMEEDERDEREFVRPVCFSRNRRLHYKSMPENARKIF